MEHTDDGFSIPEFDIPEMEMDVTFDFASPEAGRWSCTAART